MAQTIIFILLSLPGLFIVLASILMGIRGKGAPRIRSSTISMLLAVGLSMLFYAQYYNPYLADSYSWGFDFVYSFITPFCAPLYYLFVNCLTDIKRRPAINVLMFLPSVIYAVLLISAQLLMDGVERHAYICNEILGQNIQMESSVAYSWMVLIGKKLFSIFMPAQGILVMIYGEFRLNNYLRMLEDYTLAYQSGKKIKIRGIHVLTILVILTGLMMSSIPFYESSDYIPLAVLVVVGQIIMVSLVVHNVMQLEYSAEDIQEMKDDTLFQVDAPRPILPVQQPVRPQAPMTVGMPLAEEPVAAPSTLMERIDSAMMNERLFLQPDLSLTVLCEKVGTNRTYASKAIKEAKGCNFPDYVNRLRMDYALELMKQTPRENIIIQNIAMQCGCGSIQSFYRYFKMFYNETPTQWMERNK